MSAALIDFEEASHTYRVGGRVYPSVTQILDPITMLDRIPLDILQAAADLGVKVHKACHLYNSGNLNMERLDPVLVPYVLAWEDFLASEDWVVCFSERKVFNALLGYCGGLDAGLRHKARMDIHVTDIKTALLVPRTVGPQVAAYKEALINEGYPGITKRSPRLCVTLYPDRSFKVTQLKRTDDWNMFVSALNVHRWRNDKPRFED